MGLNMIKENEAGKHPKRRQEPWTCPHVPATGSFQETQKSTEAHQ